MTKDYIYLFGYKLFNLIAKKLPSFALDFLASFIYFIDKKHRKIVEINLNIAFKNKITDEQKKQISKNIYKNLIYNLADFAKNQDITKKKTFTKSSV